MPRSQPAYAPEYRRRIVERARAGRSVSELAREFEPSVETIRQWVKQSELDAGLRSDGLTTLTAWPRISPAPRAGALPEAANFGILQAVASIE